MTGAGEDAGEDEVGTVGVLLAAGAGRRMGKPKALISAADGTPWVVAAARALAAGGCSATYVVVGAAAAEVRDLLAAEPVSIVEAPDWVEGMGASLKAGFDAIAGRNEAAGLIHLVDLPDVGPEVIARLLGHAAPSVLARAAYGHAEPGHTADGHTTPGHPVLIGRDHWAAIAAQVHGDEGARTYLSRRDVTAVDCSDLATGTDVDHPGPMLEP